MNLDYDSFQVFSRARMWFSQIFLLPSQCTTFFYASECSLVPLNFSGSFVHPGLFRMTLVSVTW